MGLLASAAVSLAPSLELLPLAAAEVIRIAFRLGVTVSDVSQNLEAFDNDHPPESWAYVVSGITPEKAQRELDAFQGREVSRSNPVEYAACGIDIVLRKSPKPPKFSSVLSALRPSL